MKSKELIILTTLLLVLPVAFSITQDPRTLTDTWYYVPNYTNCLGNIDGLAVVPLEGHCENTWFFVFTNGSSAEMSVQVIPAPNMTCYFNSSNCDMSGFQTNLTFKVSRIGTSAIFGIYFGGKQSNHSVEVSKCWNWWNETDKEKRDYQRSLCPITTVSFGRWDKGATFTSWWAELDSPTGTALPDAYLSFKGYGGKVVNVDGLYSPKAQLMLSAIRNFMEISLSLWKILYYIIMIIFILTGIFFVLGVLPMGLRWIIKKITED